MWLKKNTIAVLILLMIILSGLARVDGVGMKVIGAKTGLQVATGVAWPPSSSRTWTNMGKYTEFVGPTFLCVVILAPTKQYQ